MGLRCHILVQCRATSTRLPRKCFLPLREKAFISVVVERLCMAKNADFVAVVFPDTASNNCIEELLEQEGTAYFRGSEEDVLERYQMAARHFKSDVVVRATGDNPFIHVEDIDRMLSKHISGEAAYSISTGLPMGCGVEVINTELLMSLGRYPLQQRHHEHVTLYIRENPKMFKINICEAQESLRRADIRLTVDEEKDYTVARKIYSRFPTGCPNLQDIITFLDKHPDILEYNSHVHQKDQEHIKI